MVIAYMSLCLSTIYICSVLSSEDPHELFVNAGDGGPLIMSVIVYVFLVVLSILILHYNMLYYLIHVTMQKLVQLT